MAVRVSGFTRASSLGPIAMLMGEQGGSIVKVLQDVDLPYAVLEQPELIVPLREQFRLLHRAARETGDPCFGARLGQAAKAVNLSRFGAWTCGAPTLGEAIRRAEAGLSAMLQTATPLSLTCHGPIVRWSIEFLEPETEGRHHNEFLALGYMMDLARGYAGPQWRPMRVLSAMSKGVQKGGFEEIFGAPVSHGHAAPAIEFDMSLLDCKRISPVLLAQMGMQEDEPAMPVENDGVARITAVIQLAMTEGYPRADWVASKLGLTRRSLQRLLTESGTSYSRVVHEQMRRRAMKMLRQTTLPITDIAFQLGYADAAHFTRAFRRWTGMPPSRFRERARV